MAPKPQAPVGLGAVGDGKSGAAMLARGAGATQNPPQAKGVNGNHKSALNEFVMKIAGRPLVAGDIQYVSKSTRPGQFQATAKVPVLTDEMEFQAAPRVRKRDAEQCAAQIALLYYQAKYPGGGPPTNTPVEIPVMVGGGDEAEGNEATPTNFKSALNEIAMRIAGRPLGVGDLNYIATAVGSGKFQATIKPTIIDASLEFTGESAMRKKDAEQKAAAKALEYFGNKPPVAAAPRPQSSVALGAPKIDGAPAVTTNAEGNGNFKSALNELVMRSCNRPLTADDICYTARPTPTGQFLVATKVVALDPDREFDGDVRTRKKEAEQSSAKAAFLHFQGLGAGAIVGAPALTAAALAAPQM